VNRNLKTKPWTSDDITCLGMTMLDYFAAKAPPIPDWFRCAEHDNQLGELCRWQFEYAAAMLRAREEAMKS
jgi:hypothetical protein